MTPVAYDDSTSRLRSAYQYQVTLHTVCLSKMSEVLVRVRFLAAFALTIFFQAIPALGNDLDKLQEIIGDEASEDEVPIDQYDREHWAYQPIIQPSIPTFGDNADLAMANWPANAMDAFLLRRILDAGLQPAPATDRVTLIRRLSFDLTGLPPSLEEVERFVNDSRPNAYGLLVDRLLSTPEYGQRWAQYWLDLARFAETDGYEHDKIRETAWQYRDWVIQALNDDMPYDRFLSLQLAGDLIAPDDPAAKIATAFCLSGPDMPDINSQDERKHVLLNEITSTVGAVFLSLQMGCAQCHDHKYDAISQADFYRLRAFFEPAIDLKPNQSVATLSTFSLNDPTRIYDRGDWRRPGPVVEAAFPRVVNLAHQPVIRFEHSQQDLDHDQPDAENQAERIESTTKPRVQLAGWLTGSDNPLVARSIVNRIWQFHFGKGISTTPSDFGLVGQEPSHPELLDFLASQLTRGGWSLKRLHREMLTSSFYQMTSRSVGDEEDRTQWKKSLETDPENVLWTRFPRRRLDAESIRDAMLSVSGLLNPVIEGSGVRPPLPSELVKTLKSGQWLVSENKADHYRRSIYIFARRNLIYPLFATFDRPVANCTCVVRQFSVTPLQPLTLLNSEFSRTVVDAIAKQYLVSIGLTPTGKPHFGEMTNLSGKIFEQIIQRKPSQAETVTIQHFAQLPTSINQARLLSPNVSEAIQDLCSGLLNSSLFIYID